MNRCTACGGELNTGYVCVDCGTHCHPSPQPQYVQFGTAEALYEEIVSLRTQLERAEGEMEKWRGSSQESYQLLWGVFHHFTVQGNGVQGPGHLHTVRGVWDYTGEECEWCAEWEKIKKFFHGEPIVGQTQERIGGHCGEQDKEFHRSPHKGAAMSKLVVDTETPLKQTETGVESNNRGKGILEVGGGVK